MSVTFKRSHNFWLALSVCWLGNAALWPTLAQAETRGNSNELTSFSIEDLMNIQVTSVSKKPQKVSDTAAAIFVITSEDIRRSGMASIPELLRLVPGINVGQINGNKWAISARGFNGQFANKLQVLIDGRSVYNTWFAGVYWDVQDVFLEDIERIEVIRGPGAAIWGANAVNGVINIITKHTQETLGGLVAARGGQQERGELNIRYGGKLDEVGTYRVYAKAFERNPFKLSDGSDAQDRWSATRGGFRADVNLTPRDTVQLQGDVYADRFDQTFGLLEAPSSTWSDDPGHSSGGNVLARWQRAYSETSLLDLTFYYSNSRRRSDGEGDEHLDVYDLDLQHRFRVGESHDIVWGLGYRESHDWFYKPDVISFVPASRRLRLVSAFLQDEIALRDDLHLTLGSKFEHNSYTGLEIQPNARLLWKPAPAHTLWAAVSRAVRSPARNDTDIRLSFSQPGVLVQLNGNADFQSERLRSYEVGYRGEPMRHVSVDVATFYNVYDRLWTSETGAPAMAGPPPLLILTQNNANLGSGHTDGAETSLRWQISDRWNLSAGYSWLQMRLSRSPDSNDDDLAHVAGTNPTHQAQLISHFNMSSDVELDVAAYRVARLPDVNISAYTRLDVRLGWRPSPQWELSFGVQNLADGSHAEFYGEKVNVIPSEVPRNAYVKALWRF